MDVAEESSELELLQFALNNTDDLLVSPVISVLFAVGLEDG